MPDSFPELGPRVRWLGLPAAPDPSRRILLTSTDARKEHVIITADPLRLPVNFMELFLLTLAAYVAFRTVFLEPEPLAVEQLLGPVWAAAWVVILLGGAAVVYLGLFWPGRSLTSISLQQFGYLAFSIASVARSVALLGIDQGAEAVALVMFAAFALAQVAQLERLVLRHVPHDLLRHVGLLRRLVRRG